MFGADDLVYSYTREQAIADGVLVDLTTNAAPYGFKVPLAITHAAWHRCVEWTQDDTEQKPGLGQSTEGRLADVLLMAFQAARRTDGDRAPFRLLCVPRHGEQEEAVSMDLVLAIGPGDQGEPVCTIMLPDED